MSPRSFSEPFSRSAYGMGGPGHGTVWPIRAPHMRGLTPCYFTNASYRRQTMIKLGFNFLVVVLLVLVAVFAWRTRRREQWARAGRCYRCGAVPDPHDKHDRHGRVCRDCVQTRAIQWGLGGAIALVAGAIATWVYWHRR